MNYVTFELFDYYVRVHYMNTSEMKSVFIYSRVVWIMLDHAV